MSASWLRYVLAAAMAAVVLYHLARLARVDRFAALGRSISMRGRGPADVDVTAVAMGVVMAVMLLGTLAPVDSRRLALLFAAPTLWFLCRGVHSYVMDGPRAVGSPARQVVGCAAMVYLLVALTGDVGHAMPRMTMAGTSAASPAITTLLALATLGVAGWTLARVRVQPRVAGHALAPALTAGCQVAMNVTTAYMLMAR